MRRTARVLFATATFVAALDLAQKAGSDGAVLHGRSALYLIGVTAGSIAWATAIVLTRSPAIALGAGLVLGGAAGNVLSIALWQGVPNPIVTSTIAFNLADLFVVGGFVAVAAATLGFALANRERLSEPLRIRGRVP